MLILTVVGTASAWAETTVTATKFTSSQSGTTFTISAKSGYGSLAGVTVQTVGSNGGVGSDRIKVPAGTLTIAGTGNNIIQSVTITWRGEKDKYPTSDDAITSDPTGVSTNTSTKISTWSGESASVTFTNTTSTIYEITELSVTYSTKYTVTFDGNGHGTPAETSIFDYDVTLPTCAIENNRTDLYEFVGWSTSSTATTGAAAGATYNPTKDITLYAVYEYCVNVEAGSGGEVTAKYNNEDGEDFTSGTFVPLNTVLWFEATPSSSAYSFTDWGTATTSKDNPLTYTIRDCKTFTAHFITSHGEGDEVWFARDRDAVTNGTTQSTAFDGVNTVTEENAVKSNWQVTGSYTIADYAYTVSARGTTGGPINITFTVPSGKVATLYGLAVSSGSTARPLSLTCASPTYSDDTQSTAASSTEAGQFSYSGLLPGDYTLKSTGNGAVVFLYLDLEEPTLPTITTQPVGAEYNFGATATAMTVAATASSGSLSYQWYTCTSTGESEASIGGATSSSYTPPTNASVGTVCYKVKVTDTNGSVYSNVVAVTVNANATDFTLSSNIVSAEVGAGDKTVTYTTSSTGTVTATSSAEGVARVVTVNTGTKTITIRPVAAGTATITVSQAAVTGYAAGSDVINVTVVAAEAQTEELLFYRDFTDSEWEDATFDQGNTTTADVNYDVTTYWKNGNDSFKIDGGLVMPTSNLSGSNYYIAIPVSNVNSALKINVVGTASKLAYVCKKENSVSSPGGSGAEVSGTQKGSVYEFSISPSISATGNYVIYIGRKSNDTTLKSITITTPTPAALAAPTGLSLSASKSTITSTETSTITCTNTGGYNYKWYVGTTTTFADATEVYGETLSSYVFKPTSSGTYYIFCKAINTVGEATSNYATVSVVDVPVLSFNMTSTAYNNNLNAWEDGLTPMLQVEPARLASTILPSVTYSVTNLKGGASSDLVYTDAGVAASSTANGEGYLSLHNKGGKYKVTATYVASGVSGIADGTYVTETPLQIKVIQGYDNALAEGDPVSVGGVKMVYDGDGDVAAIVTFGGWNHGNADRTPSNWTKDPAIDNTASTDANGDEKWKTTSSASGVHMDDYNYMSQGNNDSRSESKGFIEWEEGMEGIKANPYSMPCRGSYITVTPIKSGTMTIYLSQNGSIDSKNSSKVTANGPRIYYWFDQNGNVIPCESAETYSTLSNNFKLSTIKSNIVERWAAHGVTNIDSETTELDRAIKDHWNDNTTSNQNAIPYKNGYFMPEDWQSVKYSAKLLAGNTYYFFSNRTKMGYNGLNYAPVVNDGDIVIKHAVADGAAADNETVSTLALLDLTENNTTYTAPVTTTSYKRAILRRTMKKDTWTTICLPFSVSKEQVEQVFGKGTIFLGYDGFSGGTLSFIYHAYDYLIAGQPYFIKPTGVDNNGDDLESVESGYIGAKESRNYISFSNVTVSRDVEAKDVDGVKDAFEFKGSFQNQDMTPYSYYLSANGELSYSKTKTYKLGGFRAFLYNESESPNSLVLNFEIKDFSDDGETPTAVNDLVDYIAEHGIEIHTRNGVYTLSGRKIAETPENLASGLYIINGKKVYIK
ncbi:MAG: InlB B-repeat-containing protein [Prevotella sp.]|nr:InlB B-repeat-containing protein [Prevotella sp.]